MQSRPLRRGFLPAALCALLIACSRFAAAPGIPMSVLYANDATTINGAPSTATVTWLTPGTASHGQHSYPPCALNSGCDFVWFPSGFRTDVIQPGEHLCVHFDAPDTRVAPEIQWTGSGGEGWHYAGTPNVTWYTETDWSFDGYNIGPVSSGC